MQSVSQIIAVFSMDVISECQILFTYCDFLIIMGVVTKFMRSSCFLDVLEAILVFCPESPDLTRIKLLLTWDWFLGDVSSCLH